jgi:hypothetical protein
MSSKRDEDWSAKCHARARAKSKNEPRNLLAGMGVTAYFQSKASPEPTKIAPLPPNVIFDQQVLQLREACVKRGCRWNPTGPFAAQLIKGKRKLIATITYSPVVFHVYSHPRTVWEIATIWQSIFNKTALFIPEDDHPRKL